MPLYPYQCPACGRTEHEPRPVDLRDLPVFCEADGFRMIRRFVLPQIQPHKVCYSEGWRDPLSATDRREADKEADIRYEKSWQPSYDEVDAATGATPI